MKSLMKGLSSSPEEGVLNSVKVSPSQCTCTSDRFRSVFKALESKYTREGLVTLMSKMRNSLIPFHYFPKQLGNYVAGASYFGLAIEYLWHSGWVLG